MTLATSLGGFLSVFISKFTRFIFKRLLIPGASVLVDLRSILPAKPTVLVSACLLGDKVRYDGGDKLQTLYAVHLQPWLELRRHCPEMAAGWGVPRPPVQLVEGPMIRVREVARPERDVTEPLRNSARSFVNSGESWVAAILKARSPSCGSGTTPVHSTAGQPLRLDDGVFAQCLKARFPELCVVDESLLSSPEACEYFVYYCYLSQAEFEGRTIDPGIQAQLRWQSGYSFADYLRVIS